jgi:hypothetical protein
MKLYDTIECDAKRFAFYDDGETKTMLCKACGQLAEIVQHVPADIQRSGIESFLRSHDGCGAPKSEKVEHPSHYNRGDLPECIEIIEALELDFCLGNAMKYLYRAGAKGDRVEDIRKARWYLDRWLRANE